MASWKLGEVVIERIEEFTSPGLPLEMQFPAFDASMLQRNPDAKSLIRIDPETGKSIASIHTWLVRHQNNVILVDTATGNHKPRAVPRFARFNMLNTDYLGNLARAGVGVDDVTHVINTHMHIDHSGWNTKLEEGRWVPTFPRARYLLGREEYANWQAGGVSAIAKPEGLPVIADSVRPVVEAGLVDWVGDGDRPLPGFRFAAAPGHTAGQLVLWVESKGQVGVFTADTMHRAIQVIDPGLRSSQCDDGAIAEMTRRALLEQCARQNAMIFPAHFDAPHAGRVFSKKDGSFGFEPVEPT